MPLTLADAALTCAPCPLQVSLQRAMEKGAKEFAEWKKQRDRELLQLKKQGRLNAAQLQKLEALHSKQQAVLRRKTGGWRGGGPGADELMSMLCASCIERLHAWQPMRCPACPARPAEEAEAARRRLKELEDRKHCMASRPTTAQPTPPSERPFTAPPAGQPPRPPTAGTSGSTAVERSAPSASAAAGSLEAECQPNPLAPLLRDEKGRRECECWAALCLASWASQHRYSFCCACSTASSTGALHHLAC